MSTFSEELVGRVLHAQDNQRVGLITAVFQYPAEMHAAGAVEVHGGWLRRSHLVDLEDATLVEGVLTVPHDRRTIDSAPSFTPLIGNTLSESDAMRVREHYWGASQPA